MRKSKGTPVVPLGMLAHRLIDGLSVVIGNCDFGSERVAAKVGLFHAAPSHPRNRMLIVVDFNRHRGELANMMCNEKNKRLLLARPDAGRAAR
jgi:hypothetical protein